ncbi:MAG: elongation factor 1-beta [Candidatus Methanomethylicia archaeon]|nr:elongation factor 1-beta [Candidatus Methanomethylicia archaeon]MDW7988897.1 elongation factor 1-beta [Nitrososphaerota archaeon]
MGKVYVLIKVYPSSIDVDLDFLANEIKKNLPTGIVFGSYIKEPIAFGLCILKIAIIMPEDITGGTSIIEDTISGIPYVSHVEVEYVSRI